MYTRTNALTYNVLRTACEVLGVAHLIELVHVHAPDTVPAARVQVGVPGVLHVPVKVTVKVTVKVKVDKVTSCVIVLSCYRGEEVVLVQK